MELSNCGVILIHVIVIHITNPNINIYLIKGLVLQNFSLANVSCFAYMAEQEMEDIEQKVYSFSYSVFQYISRTLFMCTITECHLCKGPLVM